MLAMLQDSKDRGCRIKGAAACLDESSQGANRGLMHFA